jgi:hypothetical protein
LSQRNQHVDTTILGCGCGTGFLTWSPDLVS